MTNVIAIALAAILSVESSGGKNLKDGDGGRAVGPFQMWTVAVREVNRIYKTDYKYEDRRNFAKSARMCELTLQYHYKRGTTNVIDLACKWRNPFSPTPAWYRTKIKKAVKDYERTQKNQQAVAGVPSRIHNSRADPPVP